MAAPTETRKQRYERLWTELDTEYASWRSHQRELYEFILPRQPRFLAQDVTTAGTKKHRSIIDSTATASVRTMSAGMMSGLTSPARPWFMLTVPDRGLADLTSVKRWLHDVAEALRDVHDRSNLYKALPLAYQDLGVAGTTALLVLEDDEDDMRVYHLPVGSYRLLTDKRGKVAGMMRRFTMTVRQLVEEFGEENLSQHSKNLWDTGHRETKVEVVHAIVPNEQHDERKLDAKYKKWASCYYEGTAAGKSPREDDGFLRESGFDLFPVLAPRWGQTGEDVYGWSPAMDVLGTIKGLQRAKKDKAKGIAKQVDPALVGPTALRNERVSQLPGDITYSDVTQQAQGGLRPIHEVRIDLQWLLHDIAEMRAEVREAFFADLFKMFSNDQRNQPPTAREVQERHEEKLLQLGPVLETLDDELLAPLIDLTFAFLERTGRLPPPPPEIQGMPLKVVFVSILAQAQKMLGIGAVERFIGFIGGSLAQIKPEALDKINADQVVDDYADMLGVPPEMVHSDDEVTEIRQARAAQQAQQQQMMMEQEQAKTAHTLSQTDTTDKNALTDMLRSVGAA